MTYWKIEIAGAGCDDKFDYAFVIFVDILVYDWVSFNLANSWWRSSSDNKR